MLRCACKYVIYLLIEKNIGVKMVVKINKLFEFFLYAQEVGCKYPLVTALRASPKLKEFLGDINPDLELDWSAKSYYGLPELRREVIETQKYEFTEENILITAGTNEANFLVITQTVELGDEVVLGIPSWPQPHPTDPTLQGGGSPQA